MQNKGLCTARHHNRLPVAHDGEPSRQSHNDAHNHHMLACSIRRPLFDRLRRPAPDLRRLALFLAVAASLTLTGCSPVGTRVAGIDSTDLRRLAERGGEEVWLALPMGRWLGTRANVGRPEAVIACIAPGCRNRLVVAVLRLEGETADLAERDLRNPQMLARGIAAQDSAPASRRVDIEILPHDLADLAGFTVSLSAPGARASAVHGAALGRREGRDLRVILAVGDDLQVVRAALAQIHAEAF